MKEPKVLHANDLADFELCRAALWITSSHSEGAKFGMTPASDSVGNHGPSQSYPDWLSSEATGSSAMTLLDFRPELRRMLFSAHRTSLRSLGPRLCKEAL
jgi:hypothetical protein